MWQATALLEELQVCDSQVPTFWRWLQALLPTLAAETGALAKGTVEPPSRQQLLEQLAQMDISPESKKRLKMKDMDWIEEFGGGVESFGSIR